MPKYKVYIEERNSGFVTVECDNENEIHDLAQDKFYEGDVDWAKGDFQVVDWEEI